MDSDDDEGELVKFVYCCASKRQRFVASDEAEEDEGGFFCLLMIQGLTRISHVHPSVSGKCMCMANDGVGGVMDLLTRQLPPHLPCINLSQQ